MCRRHRSWGRLLVQPITMADVVQMALQNNYDVQIARSNPDIARFNLEGSYSAWEPGIYSIRSASIQQIASGRVPGDQWNGVPIGRI